MAPLVRGLPFKLLEVSNASNRRPKYSQVFFLQFCFLFNENQGLDQGFLKVG